MSDDRPTIVTPGDGPIELPPTPRASVEVIACVDCAGTQHVDVTNLLPLSRKPCDCGCGWFVIQCQICGRKIGEGSNEGTIDLGAVDVPVGDTYRDLFREDVRPTALELADAPAWDD